jgi:hypothetical protein
VSTYPAIAAGQRITASLLTSMLPVFVTKAADEPATSSTTLQNDDELFLTLSASATYALDGYLITAGATVTTGDLKIDWTVPSGTTMKYTSFGVVVSSPAVQYEATVNASSTARPIGTNGSSDMGVPVRAVIITSTTAGTLQLRWAQNTSSATPTIIRAGSWLRLTRIA